MPLYTYTCKSHGTFKAWNKMEASAEAQACPSCATMAPRALAAPAIGRSDSDGFDMGGADDMGGMCGMGGCGEGMCGSEGMAEMGGGHVCGTGCVH